MEAYRSLFLAEARKRLEQVRELLPGGDWEGMHLCFHTLRGMSGTMNYPAISQLAAALEEGRRCPTLIHEALVVMEDQLREVEAGAPIRSATELECRLRENA